MHRQATGKHGFTRFTMAQIWGKPSPSPLWYFLCLAMGPTPKCHFTWDSQVGSLEIPKIGTLVTLETHNFVCRSLIEVRSKKKL